MINFLKALKWRVCGCYNPDGPVQKGDPDRAQNRARYEVWKYNTFGPGRDVYGAEKAYQIVDSGELSQEPLYLNDPRGTAAMALIVAEMEGHREIAFREPKVMPRDETSAMEKIAGEEDQAIDRVAGYFNIGHAVFRNMLERLKQHNSA